MSTFSLEDCRGFCMHQQQGLNCHRTHEHPTVAVLRDTCVAEYITGFCSGGDCPSISSVLALSALEQTSEVFLTGLGL